MILLPYSRPWTQQPQEITSLDGLRVRTAGARVFSGQHRLDLATGARPTQDGLTRVAYAGGMGALFSASSAERIEYASPVSSGDFTLVAVWSAGGSGTRVVCGVFNNAGSAVGHYIDIEGGLLTLVSTDAGNWTTASGPSVTNGVVYRTVGVFKSGGGRKLFVNGALVASSATARSPSGITQFVVGVYNGGSGAYSSPFSGVIGDAYMLPTALSDAEAAEVSSTPWVIFEPQRIWAPVSVAGGTSWTVTLTDAASATDTYTHSVDTLRSLSDTASATDALVPSLDALCSLTDTASATETFGAALDAAVALLDAASASDVLTAAAVVQAAISDLASASDTSTATFEAAGTVTLTDLASATDALTCAATLLVTLADSASGTDAYTAAAELVRTLTDAASASDSISASAPGAWDVTLSDLAVAVDVIAVVVSGGTVLSAPPLARRLESTLRLSRASAHRTARTQSSTR